MTELEQELTRVLAVRAELAGLVGRLERAAWVACTDGQTQHRAAESALQHGRRARDELRLVAESLAERLEAER